MNTYDNTQNMAAAACPSSDEHEHALSKIYAKLESLPREQQQLRKIIKAKDTRAKHKHDGWLNAGAALKNERKLRKQLQQQLEEERAAWQQEKQQLQQEASHQLQQANEQHKHERKGLEDQIQLLLQVIQEKDDKKREQRQPNVKDEEQEDLDELYNIL